MPKTTVAPAITRDEWRDQRKTYGRGEHRNDIALVWDFDPKDGWLRSVVLDIEYGGNACQIRRETLPALLVLANHALPNDDPRKITHEMVAALQHEISKKCERMEAAPVSGQWPHMDALMDLSNALTALLPPRD
jgi:hypothetical protein